MITLDNSTKLSMSLISLAKVVQGHSQEGGDYISRMHRLELPDLPLPATTNLLAAHEQPFFLPLLQGLLMNSSNRRIPCTGQARNRATISSGT